MSINVGSAIAYLELDHSKYNAGLMSAKQQLATFLDDTKESSTRIEALGGAITGVGTTLTKGLTVPLAAVGAGAVKVAVDFESSMSRVKALTGAVGGEFEKLEKQAIELGSTTSFSATEASEGMQNLASAGFTVNEIMSAMPGILDLAASDNIDLASAAEVASSTLRGFGLEASKASHVADVLARAAADTNAGILDTGEAMKYIAPVASAMSLSLEEVTAAIGIMSNAGIKGGQAGTALRASLTRLANPSKEAADLMEVLGFNAYDTNGKMLSLKDIIYNLGNSMNGLSEEQKQQAIATIFGQEAMSGMLTLIQAGPQQLEKLTKSFKNSSGAAREMADTMMDNTKGAWDEFTSGLEGAGIAIGKTLLPMITKGINKITEMVNAFNNLPPSTQKTIVSIGATVAAIGPLMIIGGKLITGIGKTINLVSSITSLTGSGLVASLGAVAIPLTAVGVGFYVWHEAMDVANQKITKSREEMSWMELAIADLTGKVTYSKKELIDMGLVYDDFNENISNEFQESIKDMTVDIHDFGMEINSINVDNVMTDEEVNELVNRVDSALESCNTAIDNWNDELQGGLNEAFSVDGVIDESESVLLEYWNSRGNKEKEEAQNLYNEINSIISNARAEGRTLTSEEISAIQNYYAQIKQIELEAQANNNYELEYAQQEFKNRMSNLDAENAQKLLQERYQQSQEEQIQIRSKYDALIEIAKSGYDSLSSEEKANVDSTIARLEESKNSQLELSQSYYDEAYQYAINHNDGLKNVINKFNGEILNQKDIGYYNELIQATEHYQGLEKVTESGYRKIYNTATKTWDDLYVKVDETTGNLSGIYDLNTMNIGSMTSNDASALQDEIATWQQTAEGVLVNSLIIGNAYIDASGKITDASGEIIGSLGKVKDENGKLVDAILTTNGTPIKIGDNTGEIINKLKNTQNAVKDTNGMKANINVTDNGTSAQVRNNINNIPSYKQVVVGVVTDENGHKYWNGSTMYATGTESAMPGIASVAEYGTELIQSSNGIMTLATGRQLVNFTGGETVYNARQTNDILKSMNSTNSGGGSTDSLLREISVKLDYLKQIASKEFNKITENIIEKVDVNGITDIREIIEEITEFNEVRTI
ncbi:phage tail tape measure protein [Clostridium tertium]|uniref:phage tail tape measure protein n=1 Tax=Clostridium tertium TaxID=1559 RepID=UPI00232F7F93|nr:phage tail tape measure protein [Clostridium tertium]MDB1923399.1 phage tail tape measure protein [Clostridium tertium]MDB1930004.1 phage tail tape measure protein [Clostridium tertium]